MFSKLKIRTRLAIVVLVPILALLALAAVGYRTLYSSKIGSSSYDRIIDANALLTDVTPPTQYIVDSYVIVLGLADETDPAALDTAALRLEQLDAEFEATHAVWDAAIVDGTDLDDELVTNAYVPARAFFDVVVADYLPALRSGDTAAARDVLDNTLTPAFDEHRAAIDRVVPLAQRQVAELETFADDLVRTRSLQLLVALGVAALAMAIISVLVARSIIKPVRELTAAAVRAEGALPELVEGVHAGRDATELTTLTPVTVDSRGELASLATAMTQMQATAVQLATEQAHTRRNVSVMLANLARRNQSLLNRTLSFISQLEENERDPQTLENLFKLDHLATRMRRNAESLLVLAGSDPPRTWPRPIEAAEIVRAALSEIEAYDRVELTQIETVWVRGNSVSDLIHLLAELLDNATRFSPPETKVSVVGKLTDSGYVVSIIDQGMGMSADDLARANRELETIGRPEERSTMVLGLAVVGRLAARSNISVRLAESPFEGVTAQIRVPFDLLETPTVEPERPGSRLPTRQPPSALAGTMSHAPTPTPAPAPPPASVPVPAMPAPRPGAPSLPPPAAPVSTPPPPAPPPPEQPAPIPTPAPVVPAAPPPSKSPEVPRPVATTASGLIQRVPGSNLFEAGPHGDAPPPPPVERSAESIRHALSSFQSGFQRTTPKSHPNDRHPNDRHPNDRPANDRPEEPS